MGNSQNLKFLFDKEISMLTWLNFKNYLKLASPLPYHFSLGELRPYPSVTKFFLQTAKLSPHGKIRRLYGTSNYLHSYNRDMLTVFRSRFN